jgi:uncharacterized membrane protein YeaQ/YmgE (transglycosylase-associated protein family)
MQDGPIEIVQFMQLFDRLGDGWVALVVIGLFAGFLVRFATSNQRSIGLWSTALFGIAGAVLGVAVAGALGIALPGPGSRFLAALAGSFALSMLGGLFRRREKPEA